MAGWRRPATGPELYDVIRAERPDRRQRCIIRAWGLEARPKDVFLACAEDVCTMRELIAALHRADFRHSQRIREFNLTTLTGGARLDEW